MALHGYDYDLIQKEIHNVDIIKMKRSPGYLESLSNTEGFINISHFAKDLLQFPGCNVSFEGLFSYLTKILVSWRFYTTDMIKLLSFLIGNWDITDMLLLNRPFETRYFLWHVPEINFYFSYIPTAFLKSKEVVFVWV